ncbi:hypothetical protein RN001_013109 [Aquatica leii]|uniref:Thioredoxin domain-containing protein n=1 Tax=Aquatica leii TaxID=1421715 RepID=A0AAN7SDN1_9COLE|nr:hypothetical protein RN001_013109 [Aquatica leii]
MFFNKHSLLTLIILSLFARSESVENTENAPEENINNDTIEETPLNEVVEANVTEIDNLPSYLNLTGVTHTDAPTNVTETTNSTVKYVSCIPNEGDPQVHLVNDTELIKFLLPNPNITNKETPANCIAILFYSKYCPFSSLAAPHFNALPRAFPTLKMVAINAMWYHIFNAQNGVVGVPSLLLFHNGKPVAKFNESEYTLELFSRFITKHTGISPEVKSYVTSADFSGPVSSIPTKEDDMLLLLSWVFIVVCIAYYFSKSKYWSWIVETVQNTWRESEAQAQHEHAE